MNKRICPNCRGSSYSSYNGRKWTCPYCGSDLGCVPNERYDSALRDSPKEKIPYTKLYSIKGGRLSSSEPR